MLLGNEQKHLVMHQRDHLKARNLTAAHVDGDSYGLQDVGGQPLDGGVLPLRLGVHVQTPAALARARVSVTRVERPAFLLPPVLHARVCVEELPGLIRVASFARCKGCPAYSHKREEGDLFMSENPRVPLRRRLRKRRRSLRLTPRN